MIKKLLLVTVVIVAFISAPAYAQIVVSPMTASYQTEDGQDIVHTITLRNTTNKLIKLDIRPVDFDGRVNTNEPAFLNAPNPDYGLARWFRDNNTQPTITVPAKQSIDYDAVIQIPSEIPSRTYYGAIFFTNTTIDTPVSVASLAYIDVGNPQSNVAIEDITLHEQASFGRTEASITLFANNTGSARYVGNDADWTINILNKDKEVITRLSPGADIHILPLAKRQVTFELPDELPGGDIIVEASYQNNDTTQDEFSKTFERQDDDETPTAEAGNQEEQTEKVSLKLLLSIGAAALTIGIAGLLFLRRKKRLRQNKRAQSKESDKP